ncbi:unnamed protein product [Psylliodes chrysocephalus]|uniref:Uncharacterized protein n=1 Tax=Psylliodes chrysocephalus TaxID=3402493 RepID=A0A9P0GLH2_9CUCU|nr:unnamed protein product [Psylliodes chrysocephala]
MKRQHEEQEASTSIVGPPRTRARVSESAFCFKKQCLFCSQELNEEHEKRKSLDSRRKIQQVSTLTFKDSILDTARNRSDAMAKAVFARLEFENDLVAAEAKYHHDCFNSFLKPPTLKNVCKTTIIDNRTLKLRLKLKYGNKIIITDKLGTSIFICLVDNHQDILNQAWYEKKKLNKKEE